MVNKDDEATAVVRMLRYLEREYRGLRPDPVGAPCPGLVRAESRLRDEMSRALARAYRAGMLPLPIAEKITAVEDELRSAGRVSLYVDVGIGLASDVIGYVDAVGLDQDGEPGGDNLFLCPGSISLVWPEVFVSIYAAEVVDDGTKIETAFDAQSIVYFVLGYYAEASRMLADWIEGHFGDRLAEPVGDEIEPDDRDAIGSAALNAVVAGGLAGVLQAAVGARSVDRVTAIIRERVAADFRLYDRRADDWAAELRATKKTVTDSTGWREIMQWRAANKADRVSKKTGK